MSSKKTLKVRHPQLGEAEIMAASLHVWEPEGWEKVEDERPAEGGEADRQTAAADAAPGTPLGQDPAAAGTQAVAPQAVDAQRPQPSSSTSSDRGTVPA